MNGFITKHIHDFVDYQHIFFWRRNKLGYEFFSFGIEKINYVSNTVYCTAIKDDDFYLQASKCIRQYFSGYSEYKYSDSGKCYYSTKYGGLCIYKKNNQNCMLFEFEIPFRLLFIKGQRTCLTPRTFYNHGISKQSYGMYVNMQNPSFRKYALKAVKQFNNDIPISKVERWNAKFYTSNMGVFFILYDRHIAIIAMDYEIEWFSEIFIEKRKAYTKRTPREIALDIVQRKKGIKEYNETFTFRKLMSRRKKFYNSLTIMEQHNESL